MIERLLLAESSRSIHLISSHLIDRFG